MKKIVLSALVCLSIYACKKEKVETPVTPAATGSTKHCTAVVNGSAFSADSYFTSLTSYSPKYYTISGAAILAAGGPSIQLSGKIETGIHPVGVFPNYFSGVYRINNVTFTAISGSFNITKNDTLNGAVKHFTATFNFNTDTISGTSYQITNGDINYVNY